jgi:hypothetical protein
MPSGQTSAITYQGRTQSITEWAKEIGITAEGLRGRISKLGAEAALSAGAMRVPKSNRDMITHDGRTQSRADWAKELGLSKSGLTNRILTLGVERAISEPFRKKPTAAEMEERCDALIDIVNELGQATVRQVFYQAASVRQIISKDESGYNKVQYLLVKLRRSGEIDFDSIVDNTRYPIQPTTFESPAEALEDAAAGYRKSLWEDIDVRVEIWLEKDALTGVIEPITSKYDVALLPARGYASITFLYDAAIALERSGKPAFIYHLGDSDPSGKNAADVIERELREYAPGAEIHFERLAVTDKQIRDWRLPSRPTKTTDTRIAAYGDRDSVELDAIEPNRLRKLVEDAINRHMSKKLYDKLMKAEKAEQDEIRELVDQVS